jgi:protein-S-isoprenylcysteine O-methyltransferase Ste14
MIGSAIAVSVWWLIAVALIGGYFIYSAFVEERNMTRLFPSAYPEYQQSTKMLIPFTAGVTSGRGRRARPAPPERCRAR